MTIQLVCNVKNLIRIGKGLQQFQTFRNSHKRFLMDSQCCTRKPIGQFYIFRTRSLYNGFKMVTILKIYLPIPENLGLGAKFTLYHKKWKSPLSSLSFHSSTRGVMLKIHITCSRPEKSAKISYTYNMSSESNNQQH